MDAFQLFQLLGNLGEFFGAIAVVVTLIYLAIQIRQNSAQLRINSYQVSTERNRNLRDNVLADPENFSWFKAGLESYRQLDPASQAQFHTHMNGLIEALQTNLVLSNAGVLPENVLIRQRREAASILKCPGSIEWANSFNLPPKARERWNSHIEDIVSDDAEVPPLNEQLPFLVKEAH
jgi:hypothetical protein